MYDELVKTLRLRAALWEKMYDEDNVLKQAADAIEELSKLNAEITRRELKLRMEKPRWIPVEERLPETNEEVLVYLWHRPYIAWVDSEGQWETNDFYIVFDDVPKAWMPLPSPPVEE